MEVQYFVKTERKLQDKQLIDRGLDKISFVDYET